MKTTSHITRISIATATLLALALPAFAQISVNASASVGVNASAGAASSSVRERIVGAATSTVRQNLDERKDQSATNSAERTDKIQNRGDQATANRIDALNKLSARIGSMKLLTDNEKAALTAEIQGSVSDMSAVQAEIAGATSTVAARAALQTVAPDYRIYLLVMPQVSLLSAVERINGLVGSLQTVQSKIQSRLTNTSSLSANASISTSLADMSAQLSTATSLATAAQAEIVNLKPDQGNATVRASNTAALKDARAKVKSARDALAAARKDAGNIVKLLVTTDASVSGSASTSAQ